MSRRQGLPCAQRWDSLCCWHCLCRQRPRDWEAACLGSSPSLTTHSNPGPHLSDKSPEGSRVSSEAQATQQMDRAQAKGWMVGRGRQMR